MFQVKQLEVKIKVKQIILGHTLLSQSWHSLLCAHLARIGSQSSRSHSKFPGVPEVVGVTGEVESSCSVNYHIMDLNVGGQSSTLTII